MHFFVVQTVNANNTVVPTSGVTKTTRFSTTFTDFLRSSKEIGQKLLCTGFTKKAAYASQTKIVVNVEQSFLQ